MQFIFKIGLILILDILICTLSSCKKEKGNVSSHAYSVKPDTILFNDIPDTTISVALNWIYDPSGCGSVPSGPSTQSFTFDVNNDGIMDFTLSANYGYSFVSASNPCANYTYNASLSPISSSDSIVIGSYFIPLMEANEIIDESSIFSNQGILLMKIPGYYYYITGETYIGFKLKTGSNYNYGWILVETNLSNYKFTIKEIAINLTDNKRIKSGQKY